jgi:DNA repair exonuclease SbcCD ATPase subunit
MDYNNPYIKVTWADTHDAFTPEKIKRVKAYFQEKYNTRFIKINTKVLNTNTNSKLKTLEISDSILDPSYQKKLMFDFLDENKVDYDKTLVDRLDNRINEILVTKQSNRVKYNKWYIKNIEFSNFLSFGENNRIDFEISDGITVVESTPRNFGGKTTSTVDVLLFLFFNTTTKTKTSGEIFNRFTDKDEVSVKGVITIDGEDYIIHRIVQRKKTKVGEYAVRTELNFYKILENGETQNLSGEQRRETEQFITSAIGSQEDFLATILTTGNNLEQLIDSKPTERGLILTRFMGLDALKEKEEECKIIVSDYSKTMVSNTNNVFTLESTNEKLREEIVEFERQIEVNEVKLITTTEELTRLENEKEKCLSEKHSDVDPQLVNTNPVTLKREIEDTKEDIKKIEKTLKETSITEPKEYYLEEDHDKLRESINDKDVEIKTKNGEKTNIEKLITQLEEGSVCPSCQRPLEGINHTTEIESYKKQCTTIEKSVEKILKEIEKEKKLNDKFVLLKKEYEQYERNKLVIARYELEIEQKKHDLEVKNNRVLFYETNKKKHEKNIELDKLMIILKTKLETANSEIKNCNILIERFKNGITSTSDKIKLNNDLIQRIKKEETVMNTMKTYMAVFGKNGISKTMLRDMIPLLNVELGHLLDDSCFFKLSVNINEKNELEFVMIDTETRVTKPLNSGSGYERTIASLALRSVLTKVSSLPKPNIVVMDEVFGKVADDNLEMVGEFFKKIKDYFEHIFVISHNPLIRNWSDNILMVKKDENISTIESISTKIS